MVVLCDTCSILMLIRLAPEMFSSPQYETITIFGVAQEFIRTQKFKEKYPWRPNYNSKIKPVPASRLESQDYKVVFSIVDNLLRSGVISVNSGRLFDLSVVDKQVISFAIANSCAISTGDQGIVDFATQEFSEEFCGNIHPLGLINKWINSGLFVWESIEF